MKQKIVPISNQFYPNVLVVEDQVVCQKVLCTQLTSLGYQVDLAHDTYTAICKIKKKSYHFIITDLYLPDHSGRAVIQATRQCELNQGTPLILASAVINQQDYADYLALGADVVLVKPYSKQVLEEAIYKCAAKPAYRRKFYHQVKAVKKELTQVIPSHCGIENQSAESLSSSQPVYDVLEKLLLMIDEYQQWADLFESSRSNDLNLGDKSRSETMFFSYV